MSINIRIITTQRIHQSDPRMTSRLENSNKFLLKIASATRSRVTTETILDTRKAKLKCQYLSSGTWGKS